MFSRPSHVRMCAIKFVRSCRFALVRYGLADNDGLLARSLLWEEKGGMLGGSLQLIAVVGSLLLCLRMALSFGF
jgi:hypothetical protein